ncbi:MAG: hypothetical protein GY789_19225 [Hyphomicrobiales bacterium]|nr:hypothetical protein [Hyphomicrobiales bacterium]
MSGPVILVAVPQVYEKQCLRNLKRLRKKGCKLKIEIWQLYRDEVSDDYKKRFQRIRNIDFQYVEDHEENRRHWQGFQIKAFMMKHTCHEEIIIVDADVYFHRKPDLLFDDEDYKRTGFYFFRDWEHWQFSKFTNAPGVSRFNDLAYFQNRKQFIRQLMPDMPEKFPEEWSYIYDDELPVVPVAEGLQESGVVYMNKKDNGEVVETVYALNEDNELTYERLYGDKETFWLGCVMNDQDFGMNDTPAYWYRKALTHDYKGKPFWSQKYRPKFRLQHLFGR